jgi:peptidoglycan L-alanyl-D-glutamate endopeptidase CwlK
MTTDVTKACRDIDKLEPRFMFKVIAFLADVRVKELGIFLTETFRSQSRQDYLYSLGRSRP